MPDDEDDGNPFDSLEKRKSKAERNGKFSFSEKNKIPKHDFSSQPNKHTHTHTNPNYIIVILDFSIVPYPKPAVASAAAAATSAESESMQELAGNF